MLESSTIHLYFVLLARKQLASISTFRLRKQFHSTEGCTPSERANYWHMINTSFGKPINKRLFFVMMISFVPLVYVRLFNKSLFQLAPLSENSGFFVCSLVEPIAKHAL